MAKSQPVTTMAGTFKPTGPAAIGKGKNQGPNVRHPNVTVKSAFPSK